MRVPATMREPAAATTAAAARARALVAVWMLLLAAAALTPLLAPAQPSPGAPFVSVITIDGAIGPATVDHVRRSLRAAHDDGAAAVVLRIDTPGGLDTSMRLIIRDIVGSPVPVLAYVAPSGARAASAGTYIVYASHVAAMAPGTNIGAATPVALIGGAGRDGDGADGKPAKDGKAAKEDRGGAPAGRSASESKAINDAVAYLKSLAEMRGRNADWAERAVREAASLSAADALKQQVVDLIADDIDDLLRRADGRSVRVGAGTTTLKTAGLAQRHIERDWRSRWLGVIGDPNIALLLLMIGVYGLLFEFMSPGALIPGVVGAICLLIALYALSALPIDFVGAALLLLGIALMAAEAVAPSFGVLGIGGVVAFVIGASLLVDEEAPGFQVSLPLAVGTGIAALGVMLLAVRFAWRSRRVRVVSGTPLMIGATARVLDWSGESGHVFVEGERWAAAGPAGIAPGDLVRVRDVRGLTVDVEPAEAAPARADGAASTNPRRQ